MIPISLYSRLAGLVCVSSLFTSLAQAADLADWLGQTQVDGQLRAYQFNRDYDSHATANQRAFATALLLNAHTADFADGFSLGAGVAVANAMGSRPDDLTRLDTTLMGRSANLNTWTQGYLQYRNPWVLARAGYQFLDTPWLGSSDSRVVPASYKAVSTQFTLTPEWKLMAIRVFDWRSRTSDRYHDDNLYYPASYDGDTLYGNTAVLPASADDANGTWALGTTYAHAGLKTQAWYYDFLDFAHTGYADGTYTFAAVDGITPYVGVQGLKQRAGSSSLLAADGASLLGEPGDRVDSTAWGAKVGVNVGPAGLEAAFNDLYDHSSAVGAGAIISPYTAGYATDPLYTTSMIRGLVETGPGTAWRVKASYNLLANRLQLAAAYARYDTDLRGTSRDTYFDVTYKLDDYVKGLSIRDRLERSVGGKNNLNPGNEPFLYNRVMLAYSF